MAEPYAGMTVNERLFASGLVADYEVAVATGDLNRINEVLAHVQLRRDIDGMHWSLDEGASH